MRKRHAITLAALAAVAAVLTAVTGRDDSPAPAPVPPAAVASSTAPSPAAPSAPAPVTSTATPAVSPTSLAVAETPGSDLEVTALTVVQAWQQRDPAARHAALTPWVDPAYLAVIDEADPDQIPDAATTRAETVVEADGEAAVVVHLVTGDAVTVQLALSDDGTWRATDITPGAPQ